MKIEDHCHTGETLGTSHPVCTNLNLDLGMPNGKRWKTQHIYPIVKNGFSSHTTKPSSLDTTQSAELPDCFLKFNISVS